MQSALQEDPFTGTMFVFRAKRADRLKILFWDGTGLVMAYKRLEETTFTWPAIRDGVMTLNRAQFEALFSGLDWRRVKALEARRPAVRIPRVCGHRIHEHVATGSTACGHPFEIDLRGDRKRDLGPTFF